MGQTSVVINNITYSSVPSVTIPKQGGGSAVFYDTTDATAAAADILTGKVAYGSGGVLNGGMTNNGTLTGTISTKEGSYTIPAGYTSGGSVALDTSAKNAIVSGNIKSGATILGVAGAASVVDTSDATATSATVYSGKTCYVNGAKITGALTTVAVSQNSTTKVLSIS